MAAARSRLSREKHRPIPKISLTHYDLDDEDFESIDGMSTRYHIRQSALNQIAAEAHAAKK